MEIALLTAFLSPFLPFLLKLGEKASEKAAEKFGEDAWNRAKAIWAKLHPKVEAKEAAQEAVMDVANNPEDEDLQASLRVQLKKLLDQDQDLAAAIAQILQADAPTGTPATQIIQNVTGNQNQAIGQVTGGQVFGNVTGTVSIGTPPSSHPATASQTSETPADVPPLKTILILAANPAETDQLSLDLEVRKIQEGLERAQKRDRFAIQQRWAVRPQDVRRTLLDYKPQIVHFSGHGGGEAGLVLETEAGTAQFVSAAALAGLFELFANQVECVILNACYSEIQAAAISRYIPYVIGMKKEIGDRAAIEFSVGFYDALGAGKSYEFAYKMGCNAIQMMGIPEHLTPILKPDVVRH